MSKAKKPPKPRDAYPKLPSKSAAVAAPSQSMSHAVRETVESIVIAFVLAFLFRTFEAEAFVIPTGSMAPTLMGRHKDVDCPKCGHRFRVNASDEEAEELDMVHVDIERKQQQLQALKSQPRPDSAAIRQIQIALAQDYSRVPPGTDVVGGVCPVCRYTMPMRTDLPAGLPAGVAPGSVTNEPSYNGDRILVNKYVYNVSDPQRWDVVVFKFPGNAQMNYIKRLVGRPGEHLRIYEGNLFIGGEHASQADDYKIARKSPDKILAMRQLVHDTNFDPSELFNAGWPLRWQPTSVDGNGGWKVDTKADRHDVDQKYSIDGAAQQIAWLRYHHLVPDYDVWHKLGELAVRAKDHPNEPAKFSDATRAAWRPQLVTDFNAYNTRITRAADAEMGQLRADPEKLGIHWVGDLMVEADVVVEAAQGELLLDLVQGGKHFSCTIDLVTGKAKLAIDGDSDFAPTADTPLSKPGRYHLALSNFDDQLMLWVDGNVVKFDGDNEFDAGQIFGGRQLIRPQTSAADPGDLAPAGIGAKDAKLTVTRLQLWRDIYYIADSWQDHQMSSVNLITDIDGVDPRTLVAMAHDPSLWDLYAKRRYEDFTLGHDQFFVMGDNSPESSDARLWCGGPASRGKPGGPYLERQLLIGKALCVYWPHSWNRIPGTPIPFPLFPNFMDMRLVR